MAKRITTDKRAEAARINGAKSRGPITPEGKARSSQNSYKHGGYSRCALLLANEEAPIFDSFRDAFTAKFQPADPVETSLVDEMVFARWRMRRYWFAQDATIDLEMERQIPLIEEEFDSISEPGRLSRAITTLVDDSGSLDFLHRVEARCNRQFHRALKDLLHLQSLRQPPASVSQTPELKNDGSNPSPTQPSQDQLATPPASAHFRQPPERLHRSVAASTLIAIIFALILFSARVFATQPLIPSRDQRERPTLTHGELDFGSPKVPMFARAVLQPARPFATMVGSTMRCPIRALILLTLPLTAQLRPVTDAEVSRIHRSVLLIDTHNDVTSETIKGLDIGPRRAAGHTDLARLREGNVGAVFFAAYVSGTYEQGNRSANRALEMIDTIRHDIIARYPNDFQLALTASDILAARKKNKIAALIGIEGGHAIEDSLRLLRSFHNLGVRYMTLTHSNSNRWADSSGDAKKPNNGLSDLGRQVVREMNRLGMMVDVSHVADKTFWDVLETSAAPPFASHSSCRALSNIPRNMTDEMIAALARKGGVVQINFGCEFLSQKSADTSPWSNPQIKRTPEAAKNITRATLADAVAHIDHIVRIAGIDSVGIGSDYDGVSCVPIGLEDVSKFPNLTRALLEKGYSPADIAKIYGANLLRVMRAAEKLANAPR